jgi:FixJ family two-component response regulator
VDHIILIAPAGASGPLRGLVDRLASIGVTIEVVEEIAAAAEASARRPRPPAVLLDLRDTGAGEEEDVSKVTDAVRRTIEALPHALPIVLTAGATAPMVVAAIRAGAGDVLDLMVEGTAAARAVVQRICQRQADRHLELSVMEEQRAIVEELLKDLIRTERRAIDAEDALAARTRTSREFPVIDARPPAVLLVEADRHVADDLADRLEAVDVATFAYVSGEEAIREAAMLAETSGLDLALVAAHLPGMNGLETVGRLRERIAGLPAFLMTSEGDEPIAGTPAELGIIGFVQKPFANIDGVIQQIAELARESRHRTREALYLQRIKARHEHVLERYRSLPRAP